MSQFTSGLMSRTAMAPTATVDDLIDPPSAAQEMGISNKTLANWRVLGKGPGHYKIGGKVMYRRAEVHAWLVQRRRTSTSDPGQAA